MYLLEENVNIDYNKYRNLCKKYILTTSSSLSIANKYKELKR